MRRITRSVLVTLLAILGSITLAIGSAFTAAFAYGAIALIVPGTGTPNANIVAGYLEQARDRYLTTTACGADGSGCPDANLQGINYPASFFPLAIFPGWCRSGPDGCDKWDESVGKGSAALDTAIQTALDDPNNAGQQIVVFGYSQGGAVVADSLDNYINGLSAPDKARIQVVTIGGIENPDGGLWQRLAFLKYIPFLDVSFNPPMNPDTGVNYTSYGFEYDPVVNAPKYFGNAFALVNALAAFENVHGYYLAPNGNDPTATLPFGYTNQTLSTAINCTTSPANCRMDKYGNTYVTIPALTLPIYDLLLSAVPAPLKPLAQPIVNLLTPVTRLLIDLGYDNTGDPSVPTPLSLLPVQPGDVQPGQVRGPVRAGDRTGHPRRDLGISSLPVPATSTPTTVTSISSPIRSRPPRSRRAAPADGGPRDRHGHHNQEGRRIRSEGRQGRRRRHRNGLGHQGIGARVDDGAGQGADRRSHQGRRGHRGHDAQGHGHDDQGRRTTARTDTKADDTKADTTKADTKKADDTKTATKKAKHDKATKSESTKSESTKDAGSDTKNAA